MSATGSLAEPLAPLALLAPLAPLVGRWATSGTTLDADGSTAGSAATTRFDLRPDGDSMAVVWERQDGGTWRRWMELTLTRVDPGPPG